MEKTIYAVADLHGKKTFLQKIRENVTRYQPDVLVVAGDMISFFRPLAMIEPLNELNLPVAAILGNLDIQRMNRLFDDYPNFHAIHGKTETLCGMRFVGIGGTIPVPFHSRICWQEERFLGEMLPFADTGSVVVTHTPPRGMRDEVGGKFSAGSGALRNFILKAQPFLNICGHIHERSGTAFLGDTLVVNCAMSRTCGGALIRISRASSPRADVEMLG